VICILFYICTHIEGRPSIKKKEKRKRKKQGVMNVFIGNAVNQRAQLMATPKMTLMARGTVTLLEAPVYDASSESEVLLPLVSDEWLLVPADEELFVPAAEVMAGMVEFEVEGVEEVCRHS
jgi:hypothetical protein